MLPLKIKITKTFTGLYTIEIKGGKSTDRHDTDYATLGTSYPLERD